MIRDDYHVHSSFSGDSATELMSHISCAVSKEMDYLCITDHMDLDYPLPPSGHEEDICSFELDIDSYLAKMQDLRQKLDENSLNLSGLKTSRLLHLMCGIEIGLQTHVTQANREIINNNNFDFVIGSLHVLDNADPYYPEYWTDRKDFEVYRHYFETIDENIQLFNDFDVLGHLDYIIRYGNSKDSDFRYADFSDVIDSILRRLIENGKGIEINTGGLRSSLKFPNPTPDILKRYKELGGEIITVGSDAHKTEHLRWKFDVAEEILKECGFEYYTIFSQRKPVFRKL